MTLRVQHYTDIENAYDNPKRIAKLAGSIDEDALVVGTGDNLSPGVLSIVSEGKQSLDFFEAVDPDFETIGNHDFDNGIHPLIEIINESPQTWVCANLSGGFFEDGDIQRSAVKKVSGEKVAVTGVTHPEIGSMNPIVSEIDIDVTDPASAVDEELERLKRKDIDHILVLSHLGSGGDGISGEDLARRLDVDAVLDGHRHEAVAKKVEGTLYTRSGQGGDKIAELHLGEEENRSKLRDVTGSEINRNVEKSLLERGSEAGLTEIVDTVQEPIDCGRQSVRAGESRVGNLVTDAYRWKTGADLAVHAPGGIRKNDRLEGDITVWDLMGLVPFEDELVVVELGGERIYELLEYLAVEHIDSFRDWYFGHLSGGSIVWDDAESEVLNATVDGDPIESNRSYRVATSDYYVETHHLFPNLTEDDIVEKYGEQYETLIEYARRRGIEPRIEGRIEIREGYI